MKNSSTYFIENTHRELMSTRSDEFCIEIMRHHPNGEDLLVFACLDRPSALVLLSDLENFIHATAPAAESELPNG